MIEVENTCHDCPFCSYDGYDESYDCSHEDGGRTLAIREDFGAFNKKLEEWKESKDTLFPLDEPNDPNPLSIPDWCPLPDVEV